MDIIAVPDGAGNPDSVFQFVSFMLESENSGMSSNLSKMVSVVNGAGVVCIDAMEASPELKVPDTLPVAFAPRCSEAASRLLDRVWTKAKT